MTASPTRAHLVVGLAALAFVLGGPVVPVGAQPARTPPVLDRRLRGTIIDSLGAQVMRNYIEADTARMIVDHVRRRLKAGAYDAITSPTRFAEAVTEDLRHVNGDLHLSLRWDPEGRVAMGGPVMVRRTVGGGPWAPGPGPGGVGRRVRGPGPGAPSDSGGAGGPGGPPPPWMREAVQRNYGLERVEILPGNVGYLEITGFMGAPGSEEALVAALRFLERTDAIILDVRRNRGGSGEMSHLLFSHFLPPDPVPTIRVKSRIEGLSRDQTSLSEVPGPRRPEVPIWVLTSRGTGSAAEEFSFVLQNLGRAALVGDRTAGAGHMVNGFALPEGFVAGVSITRVSDPRTGREWEAVGVQPDVRVEPERALAVAHAAALRELIAVAEDPGRRRTLEMLVEWVEARAQPLPLDGARLAALVGRYDGEREVRLVDGRLEYRRGQRMPSPLVAIAGNRFSLDGEARIEFAPGSPSPDLIVEQADGTRTSYPREGGGK